MQYTGEVKTGCVLCAGRPRKFCGRTLEQTEEKVLERVRAFDRACIKKNLSPGGSADLLALTVSRTVCFHRRFRRS